MSTCVEPTLLFTTYIDLLRLDKAAIVRYDPQFVAIDADSPDVLKAGVDEVEHHPPSVLSMDDLSLRQQEHIVRLHMSSHTS